MTIRRGEVVELLQHLIRNACVNDGDPDSGNERLSADLLKSYLEGSGLELELYEPAPGRASLVGRIEGSDPDAPSVCLMGHTDVVPVSPEGWHEDPFGGELIDGEVWGRGAVDMLNMTASMAVAVRSMALSDFRPRGTLVFLAVADEESGGRLGVRWLIDHAWDSIGTDYVLTESGGLHIPSPTGPKVTVTVAEKGVAWRRLRVRGTPSHGSAPWGSDNALVKAAEVVRRLAAYRPAPQISDAWRRHVEARMPDELHEPLLDPARVWDTCERHDGEQDVRYWHACTHTTVAPTVARGGQKTNIVPDIVDLDVDIRTLPGETAEDVVKHLQAALGDLYDQVEVSPLHSIDATSSPVDTHLWDCLERQTKALFPEAGIVPRLAVGASDAGWLRQKGTIAYGCGLMSPTLSEAEYFSRFHGNDERVDVTSLELSTSFWERVARDSLM